jgi:hypothetical protein
VIASDRLVILRFAERARLWNGRCWPISEVAARLIKVRSVGHSGLDLLTLSSSHFDPEQPLGKSRRLRGKFSKGFLSAGLFLRAQGTRPVSKSTGLV